MGYYGITFSATNLSEDFFLNYELAMQVSSIIFTCCRLHASCLQDCLSFQFVTDRIVEIPAYIGGIFVMDKLGRRPTLSGGLIISGIACLITGLVPEGNVIFVAFNRKVVIRPIIVIFDKDPPAIRITFSMIGKLFISCVMATVYSYTSDLFPTPARSAAVGICSTTGRIGGILAPIIANAVK